MVDRRDVLGGGRAPSLQEVLDEIDAPARALALVAGNQVGRTGRGAEAAMHAGAQDLLQRQQMRVGEPLGGEVGLHRPLHPCVHPPEVEHSVRIEARLHALRQTRERRRQGLEHGDAGA